MNSRAFPRRPAGGTLFTWTISIVSGLFVGGFYLDGWAHTHGRVDETFFTPWHAVLYSAYLLVASVLVITAIRNRAKGLPWQHTLPDGYWPSMIGILLWIPGGLGDLVWHQIFGIEVSGEALLSPTHLLLAFGAWLIVSGPFRAAWRAPNRDQGLASHLPMLLSLTYMLSVLTFFTQTAHPLANLWGHGLASVPPALASTLTEQGVLGILLSAGVIVGIVLVALHRWELPPGALTIVFTLNAVAMGFLYDQGDYPGVHVAALAGAGLGADLLLAWLRPSTRRPFRLRLLALGISSLFTAGYFLAAMLTGSLDWSVHVWTGTIILSGVVGWLSSYLVVPPLAEQAADEEPNVPRRVAGEKERRYAVMSVPGD